MPLHCKMSVTINQGAKVLTPKLFFIFSQIYALNKILAEVEKSNYEKFKEERGLPV